MDDCHLTTLQNWKSFGGQIWSFSFFQNFDDFFPKHEQNSSKIYTTKENKSKIFPTFFWEKWQILLEKKSLGLTLTIS
jgi:hypothetical protein